MSNEEKKKTKERAKLNPIDIVFDHLSTLVRIDTKKLDYWAIIILFILPLLLSVFLLYRFDVLSSNIVNILISTFSIFVGLLLNLLLLIYDLTKKFNAKEPNIKIKRKFLKEIFANISYSILISIIIIFFLLFSFINMIQIPKISAFIVYFLVANFFLTILMVLKRIHLLLHKEFDKPISNNQENT